MKAAMVVKKKLLVRIEGLIYYSCLLGVRLIITKCSLLSIYIQLAVPYMRAQDLKTVNYLTIS